MPPNHWQDYWNQKHHTSFGAAEPEWYRNTLIPFWRRVFSESQSQARVLDVATGNGAISRIAVQTAQERGSSLFIEALDQVKTEAVEGVRLLPPCPLETFESEPVYDLITAQFGLEYSSMDRSLPRLASALKPGGRLVVVAHHVDSSISHFSRVEMEQYRALFQQKLFPRLERLLQAMGEIRSARDRQRLVTNKPAQNARTVVNRAIARLTGQYPQGIVIAHLLKQINPLFQQMQTQPLAKRLTYLKTLERELKHARSRLADQLDAALDDRDLEHIRGLAEHAGLELIRDAPLQLNDGRLLAWQLSFVRSVR